MSPLEASASSGVRPSASLHRDKRRVGSEQRVYALNIGLREIRHRGVSGTGCLWLGVLVCYACC